jgi:predicted metal-dependent phosphoesterase TrpH
MIDLQLHSCFSDGSDTPTELVKQAKKLGLTAIALTDHDTIYGIPEFIEAGLKYNIITVPGVEISVDTKLPNNGHMHILGLFIDPKYEPLKNHLDFLRKERNKRAVKIIDKLAQLGHKITLEELHAEAGEGSIGRPHVAKLLLRRNIVSSLQEAFDLYLAKGKPAYIDKIKFDEAGAIGMIKEAQGLAVLAHPNLMNYNSLQETKERILSLKKHGLDGFEVYYSRMSQKYSNKLIKFAKKYNFAISGGSDYHGKNKDNISMGTGMGQLNIPDSVYTDLENRWLKNKKPNLLKVSG